MVRWSHRATGAAVIGSAVLLIAAFFYVRLGIGYSRPEVTRTSIGGKWQSETVRRLGGSTGGHTALYRVNSKGRVRVAPIVFKETYVGDDCVIYGSPAGCWIACGERAPIEFAPHCDTWEIRGTVFRALDGSAMKFDVVELKSRVMRRSH